MKNTLPIIAIVGPPNAGKSTLLNKIVGKPLAVTSEIAGTTRDRQYADITWNGKSFTLADTAGLILDGSNELEINVKKQIDVAVIEADALLLVVDGKQPVASLDRQVLQKFRALKKPTFLLINKTDSIKTSENKLAEFSRLGIKNKFAISAITGNGIGDLLDSIVNTFDSNIETNSNPAPTENAISVAIVGKPNVGKSSLFNKILKSERAVVSAMAGTTRTSVDSKMVIDKVNYTFIDTAGLKKKTFRQEQPDIFSGFQTFKSIRRSDICLFVIDSSEEISKQDQQIAQEIFTMDKGCIILANKSDLVDQKTTGSKLKQKSRKGQSDDKYSSQRDLISHHFPFLWSCPVFFVSAKTGEGLSEAIKTIEPIFQRRQKQIAQEELDALLARKIKYNPPKLLRDQKKPKVFGLKQLQINPPQFELFVNHPAAISMQFRKYIQNAIVKELDFWGTPVNLKIRGKDKS
jgi:GTP-binding protein